MNILKIQAILERHTFLVRQLSARLHHDGPLDLRITAWGPTGLMMTAEAEARGLTLIKFPGIAVGVKMPEAKRDGGQITRLLSLPPKPKQSKMTALVAMTYVPKTGFDLGWRLRLAAFGHLVNGWQLSSDGKEVIWRIMAFSSASAERDKAIAHAMLNDKLPKRETSSSPPAP